MAYKYREELVGKRFLSLSGLGKLKLSRIGDWEWRAGIIRAASFRDPKQLELTVLVEFDDVDWKRREWIRVYEENIFQVFAVENTLVWTNRRNHQGAKSIQWPGINYKFLVDKVGLKSHRHQPVEFLVDKTLTYLDYAELKPHQESEEFQSQAAILNYPEVAKAVRQWSEYQDGQRILLTTPSVLVGYRVEVYRSEGTTQWYTAVIVSYNENTRELTLTDDTVLEEHNEDPSLVQMRLIGDGVVESILRGENIGITPRRRTCTLQHQHLGHYTRTRSQAPSHVPCPRILPTVQSRKTRVRTSHEFSTAEGGGSVADSDKDKERLYLRDKKAVQNYDTEGESSTSSTCSEELLKNRSQRRKKQSGGTSASSDSDTDLSERPQRRTDRHRSKPEEDSRHRTRSTTADGDCRHVVKTDDRLPPAPKSKKSACKSLVEKSVPNDADDSSASPSDSERHRSPPPTVAVRRCSVVLDVVENHPSLGGAIKSRLNRVEFSRHSCRPVVIVPPNKSVTKAGVSPQPGVVEPLRDGASAPSTAVPPPAPQAPSPHSGRTDVQLDLPIPSQKQSADDDGSVTIGETRERTPPPSGTPALPCSTQSVIDGTTVEPTTAETPPGGGSLVLDKNEPVKIWRDPKLVRSDKSVRHIRSVQHSTMAHPAGAGSFPAAATMGQHGRTSAAPPPPSLTLPASYAQHLSSAPHSHVPVSTGSTAAYLEQQAALRLTANSAAALGVAPPPQASSQPNYAGHHAVVAQHLLPPQYQTMHSTDLMWLQKYPPAPSPSAAWVLKYQEDQERAILIERERHVRMERDMRERLAQADLLEQEQLEKERKERAERERREKEKLEKEKLERERLQKERLEQERAKKERAAAAMAEKQRLEQERVQRDVHQHFEESLRLVSHKMVHPWNARVGVPSRSIPSGGSPVTESSAASSHLSEVSGRVSGRGAMTTMRVATTVAEAGHSHQRQQTQHLPQSHHPHHHHHHQHQHQHHHHHHNPAKEALELDLKDVRILANAGYVQGVLPPEEQQQRRAREEEKWLAMQRHHEAAVTLASVKPANLRHPEVQHRGGAPSHGYSTSEVHSPATLAASGRHKAEYALSSTNPQSQSFGGSKSSVSGSTGPKSEPSPNYNLYGYQPFQHSYIIQERASVVSNPATTNAAEQAPPKVSGLDPGKVIVTGSLTQTVAPSHHRRAGHGTPPSGVPYADHDRRFHPPHNSVIVSSESVRHDSSKCVSTSAKQLPPPPKMANVATQERTSPAYPSLGAGSTAFRPYEYGHSQGTPASDGHLMRVVTLPPPPHHSSHHHHVAEPQNLHKGNLGSSDPYAARPPPPPRSSPSVSTAASASASGYGGHASSPLPATTAASHPQGKPAYSCSNLIQQGLVPNPMYNQAVSGQAGGSRGGSTQPSASCHSPCLSSSSAQSSYKSAGKTSTPPGGTLPLPTRSSPGVSYGKASIVAGTPVCRLPATGPQQFSRQTPPPAHHNGGRGQPDHSRPPSAHSRPSSSGLTPPSRTATPGQTSHSPLDCGVGRRSSTPSASPHLCYSSPLPPIGSPHVPSPLPLTGTYGLATSRSSSSCSSSDAVRPLPTSSPPQTQPLDLQAPDRQRDGGSPGPVKRKTFKESQARKRPKPMMIGVANEGLAAAVASAHQIMSSHVGDAAGPLPARVSAPSPLVIGAATAITTVVNSAAMDTSIMTSTTTASQPSCMTTVAPVTTSLEPAQVTVAPTPPPPPPPPVVTTTSQDGFLNSYRSFVHSTQQQSQVYQEYHAYQYGKHKGKHKVSKGVSSSVTPPDKPPTTKSNVPISGGGQATSVPRPARVATSSPANGPLPEPEKAASPALSTGSASTCSNPVTKLKKEWLIRHSNEDGKSCAKSEASEVTATVVNPMSSAQSSASGPSPVAVTPPVMKTMDVGEDCNLENSLMVTAMNGHTVVKLESGPTESATSEDSEADSVSTNSTTLASAPKTSKKRKTRSKRKSGKDTKKHKSGHESRSERSSFHQDEEVRDLEEEVPAVKIEACPPRKRGRKPKTKSARADAVRKSKSSKLSSVKSGRLSLARLKRTGETFLQKGPCYEVAHKLSKCRECRMTQNQRSKKLPNIFCRFYEFRRFRYSKNGFLTIAGFSEPQDATEEDLRLWLPLVDDPPVDLEVDTSEFIVTHVGDQFCDLVEQEREAQAMHMSEDKTIAWKRVVQGVREMCDVCETTLFNIHWACNKCGFVVCIDCYKARRNGTVKEEENPGKDRDEYSWLHCNNRQAHEQEKLMLTQIIAGNALWDMGKYVHEIRKKWGISSYCACTRTQNESESKTPAVNGFCKQLMSAVTKCFVPDSHNESSNGGSESIKSSKKLAKAHNSINGTLEYIKQEGGVAGYNPDGASPLSWLADVALNSSSKLTDGGNGEAVVKEKSKDRGSSDARRRSVPSDSSDAEDNKNAENYSTLRELLIRPTSKGGSTNKSNNGTNGSHKKKMSRLDEVISHVIQQSANNNVERLEKPPKEEIKLLHYMKRYPQPKNGREPLPIRIFTLEESRLLFPGTPHSWLCGGRLLRLLDPYHKGNLKLFQEQWKRGQPVLVSEVNKRLDLNLWHPEAFARDFGDIKNDLVNCNNGNIVPNQPMRKFWEGFETFAKRMKDENGDYMLLKLKDWPPGDDFSEMLPSRFDDLMKALPLPEYTHRNGLLNMAGRLPECFVRPDLGPKMYNAYGSAQYPDKGTTNLHLDISDAVNVMVYVGIPKDGNDEQHIQEALKAIEEGGCDTLTQRRVRDKGQRPGALWHIYNARDADKIRDLLNKVAIERGEKLEPHHDPIHDQSWYLDGPLRERLYKEYGVEGYAIAQCLGDAVFIPAGAPHQVRNLHSCIKVAEDFVSPENISHCFTLTQEFRHLSDTHTNHEDKLQVKNIIYHAVRDALALLMGNDPTVYYKNKKNQDGESKL